MTRTHRVSPGSGHVGNARCALVFDNPHDAPGQVQLGMPDGEERRMLTEFDERAHL